MKQAPKDIHQFIVKLSDERSAFALALVLNAEGSTPCKAGSKAVIDASGAILGGTIGGGAVEAEAQRLALDVIKSGSPLAFNFNLEGIAVDSRDPICGGSMRVLLDPAAKKNLAAYSAVAEARRLRERGVLITTIQGSPPNVEVNFLAESVIPSKFGFPEVESIRSALTREEAKLFVKALHPQEVPIEALVEPLVPNPRLVILGGGHIGQALAVQADLVGFDILVIDDRTEFTAADLFPDGVAAHCGPIVAEIERMAIGSDTYIVIVTRGHRHDAEALAVCLKRPAAYIGMIGSRRKVALMRKEFIESGRATAAEFDRVHAPIGLDIGAVSVPEIAASITAELIAVRRKNSNTD